jgi:hypothetical protein
MIKLSKEKKRSTKTNTEDYRLSNTNPTNNGDELM